MQPSCLTISWNLPPGDRSKYEELAKTVWFPKIKQQPGLLEINIFRNAASVPPDVFIGMRFADSESFERYLASADSSEVISGFNAAGCSDIKTNYWIPSPLGMTWRRPD